MDQFVGRIEVLADPSALARRAAEWMTATASAAKERFRVALSGGSTPKALYGLLASEEFRDRFPWRQVSWFWGDERFVPYDHPESNYRMTREAMSPRRRYRRRTFIPSPPTGRLERFHGSSARRAAVGFQGPALWSPSAERGQSLGRRPIYHVQREKSRAGSRALARRRGRTGK